MQIDVRKKIKHNADEHSKNISSQEIFKLKNNTFKYLKHKCLQTKFHSTAKTEMFDNLKFA